jgi:hypothetical protein
MQKSSLFLSRPLPILCSEPASFAEYTLLTRLPEIARRIIKENHFSTDINRQIETLISELPGGVIQSMIDPGASDLDLWKDYLASFIGQTWHQLPFWVCENVFYRRILEITGYFQKGPTFKIDPFSYQKGIGLELSRSAIHSLSTRLETWLNPTFIIEDALSEAIELNLWGNRADLSLFPADADSTLSNTQLQQAAEFMLVDNLSRLVEIILNLRGCHQKVEFLIDNAGYELVCDMALADLLINRDLVSQVVFQLKAHPTFVSDALPKNVQETVDFLLNSGDEKTANFGNRMAVAIAEGKFILEENFFWNSPLSAWDMPDSVRDELASSALVISKGDAHYRRLVGDLHWPDTTPFNQVLEYFPTQLVALRTMKSDVVVGLNQEQVFRLNQLDPLWRTDSKWGLVRVFTHFQ